MSFKSNKVTTLFTPIRIAIPILIGVIVSLLLLFYSTDWNVFKNISWGISTILWLFVALIFMVIRDLAYMVRIRLLTDNKLNWKKSFEVIMLWEFASAITPSVVGGSGVAVYILNKEGINIGKSTATVMITALLDELFYIVTVPLVIFVVGTSSLFPISMEREIAGYVLGTKQLFIVGYVFILLLTTIILLGIFFSPKSLNNFLGRLGKIKLLKKWKEPLNQAGLDIMESSKQFKSKNFIFWLKAFGTTVFSWTARFWVVNFILLAFTPSLNHLLIYARQLVMWIIMLISPTPGGAGVAEFVFDGFLKDFTPYGFAIVLAILWRLISYYPYLIIGGLILPKWLKRVYKK